MAETLDQRTIKTLGEIAGTQYVEIARLRAALQIVVEQRDEAKRELAALKDRQTSQTHAPETVSE